MGVPVAPNGLLEAGAVATVRDIAAAAKINESYVSRALRQTLLTPDIVEAILDGRQPAGWCLPALLKPRSCRWDQQRDALPAYPLAMSFPDAVAPRHILDLP